VPTAGATPGQDEIRGYLRSRLAVYKVPRRVLFFRADELSYTGNQKVQLQPLAEAAQRRLESENAEVEGYRYGS
jgi:acyl-CoA synthetase (AMP-forming)/AMP-acid ligase II